LKRFSIGSETDLILVLGLGLTGLLMTLPLFRIFRHYLVVAFPLMYVLVPRVLSLLKMTSSKMVLLLSLLWVALAGSSICFLKFIHCNGGVPLADYGMTWAVQNGEGGSCE
jgi:hypothetical protein